jgi:hypothetical protein
VPDAVLTSITSLSGAAAVLDAITGDVGLRIFVPRKSDTFAVGESRGPGENAGRKACAEKGTENAWDPYFS